MAQSSGSTEQHHDLAAIEVLRDQFKAAQISNEPNDLAPLLTDDFVYYQPSFEGPCTYGKQAHLNYVSSMPRLLGIDIRLLDFILMGRWAFESGEEHYRETSAAGGQNHQVARFARLLYRNDLGAWQIARTARGMALDLHCVRNPPSPERLSNGGRGRWQAMPIDIDAVNESEWLVAADQELMRQMLVAPDPGALSLASAVKMAPEHHFASTTGNYTWQDFEGLHKSSGAKHRLDDLQRHNEDARVIVPRQWGYSMGRGIFTGSHNQDGQAVRYGGVHLYLFLWQRVDAGRDPWPWKIRCAFSCDMVNPFGRFDPENPLRSDVAHQYLEAQRRGGVLTLRNKFEYLSANKQ